MTKCMRNIIFSSSHLCRLRAESRGRSELHAPAYQAVRGILAGKIWALLAHARETATNECALLQIDSQSILQEPIILSQADGNYNELIHRWHPELVEERSVSFRGMGQEPLEIDHFGICAY